jgi:hypothetical protein
MKTEYRLVPIKQFGTVSVYLQFKQIETYRPFLMPWKKKEREVWRYVPNERYIWLHGYYLYPKDCPRVLPMFYDYTLESSFLGHENWPYEVGGFHREWPDINKYFARHRAEFFKRQEEKRKLENNAKVIYLDG